MKKSVQKPVNPNWSYRPKCYDRTPFSCIWCDVKFDSIRKIEVHVRTSHKYNCNHCVKVISTWKELVKHAEDCSHSKRDLVYFEIENNVQH
jgi:hypothetical protein